MSASHAKAKPEPAKAEAKAEEKDEAQKREYRIASAEAAGQGNVAHTLSEIADRLERIAAALVVVSDQLKQAFSEIKIEIGKIKTEQ